MMIGLFVALPQKKKNLIVTAATNYCNPTVAVKFKEWQCSDKIILEVSVPESEQKPVFCKKTKTKSGGYIYESMIKPC